MREAALQLTRGRSRIRDLKTGLWRPRRKHQRSQSLGNAVHDQQRLLAARLIGASGQHPPGAGDWNVRVFPVVRFAERPTHHGRRVGKSEHVAPVTSKGGLGHIVGRVCVWNVGSLLLVGVGSPIDVFRALSADSRRLGCSRACSSLLDLETYAAAHPEVSSKPAARNVDQPLDATNPPGVGAPNTPIRNAGE